MNQLSKVPFGTDASVVAGYAQVANDRLGNIDFIFENTGDNVLSAQFRTMPGVGGTGYTNVGAFFTVQPGGTVTKSLSLVDKVVGFFGSGSTTANITAVIRNRSDLRCAQIDMYVIGKKGWTYDNNYPSGAFQPNWPVLPS